MNQSLFNHLQSCTCGTNVLSNSVKVKNHYSLWGWFLWTQGSTVTPKKMDFICTKCNKKFCELDDKNLIKEYMIMNPY